MLELLQNISISISREMLELLQNISISISAVAVAAKQSAKQSAKQCL
jgi:post-segregation antitoxin (ccd killing protein)